MAWRSYPFACTSHYIIIIIMQMNLKALSYETFVRYMLSSVCLRLSPFFQLSFTWYMRLCSFLMIVRIVVPSSYNHHQIVNMNIGHCLGLDHEKIHSTPYVVLPVCHQVRCMHWRNLSFHRGMSPLTLLPLDKVAAILQTIFSYAFSWMKSSLFWLKSHWSLFLRV